MNGYSLYEFCYCVSRIGFLVAVARIEKTRGGKNFALSATGSQPNKKLGLGRVHGPAWWWCGGARAPYFATTIPARLHNTVAMHGSAVRRGIHAGCCQGQRPVQR